MLNSEIQNRSRLSPNVHNSHAMKTITVRALGFRMGVVDAVVTAVTLGLVVAGVLGLGLLASLVLG